MMMQSGCSVRLFINLGESVRAAHRNVPFSKCIISLFLTEQNLFMASTTK